MTEEFASLCSLHLSGSSLMQEATPPLHPLSSPPNPCSPWPAIPWEDAARALCPTGQGYLHSPAWLSHIRFDPTRQSFEHFSLYHNQLRIPKVILGSCPQNIKINTCSNTLISSLGEELTNHTELAMVCFIRLWAWCSFYNLKETWKPGYVRGTMACKSLQYWPLSLHRSVL